jgi:hypothetical protein
MGYNGQKPDGQRTPGQKLRTVFTGILDSLFKMNSMFADWMTHLVKWLFPLSRKQKGF